MGIESRFLNKYTKEITVYSHIFQGAINIGNLP